MLQTLIKGAAGAALFSSMLLSATPANARDWDDYHHHTVQRCDRDGDRCATFRCDRDGDDCHRISAWRYQRSYSERRYDYSGDRTVRKCDRDGDRCATYRCDRDGDRCTRLSGY